MFGAGKHVVVADVHGDSEAAAAEVMRSAGFAVSTATTDVSSRESVHQLIETATSSGDITGVIHAAGVSPSQAAPAVILEVDLYGTAVVLEEFGDVTGPRGQGYRHMIELSRARRAGTPDEVGALGVLLDGSRRHVHHRQRLSLWTEGSPCPTSKRRTSMRRWSG